MKPRIATIGTLLGLAVVVGTSIVVRWPGFTQGGFASHDVAGILYNAMLLDIGGLPYVDSAEMKSPGTFYLAWLFAGPAGHDIARFQFAANVWAVLSLVAVAAIAWRRFGRTAAWVAASTYALHDAHLDTMDANYITWAQLPLVLTIGASLEALGQRSARSRLAWFVVAGVSSGLATLCKLPAGVALMIAIAVALWPRSWLDPPARAPRDRIAAVVAVGCGFVLAHVPIALHYAAHGELAALWRGYVANEWGMDYVALGTERLGADAAREGTLATAYFLPLPLALASFTVFTAASRPRSERELLCLLWIASACTWLAAWVGFRFYKDYFLLMAAPLALLASAPGGLLGVASPWRGWKRWIALVPALVLVARQLVLLDAERVNRARAHDAGARTVARHVDRVAPPGARIWVWGWHLWDVYALTGRLAGTRYYKGGGMLTSGNDATWRRPPSRLRFVPGPHADHLVEELRASKPHCIVLGSTVPSGEFQALRELLRSDYQLYSSLRLNRVQFWRLREPKP